MVSNVATTTSHAARSANHCLYGSSLADALTLCAELAQWAEDAMGAPASLTDTVAMVFDVYLRDQTSTRAPLDITLEQLVEDGHILTAEGWAAVQPLFVAEAARWADCGYLDAPAIGPLVAASSGSGRVAA